MRKNKTSKNLSSNISNLKSSSSLSTTQPNSGLEMEKDLPSVMAPKESLTSSLVPPKASSQPWKLKQERGLPPQNNSSSSQGSTPMGASGLLPTRLTKLWQLFKALPKALVLWSMYKITRTIVNWRTRPVPILIHPDKRLKRIAKPVDFEKTTLAQRSAIVRKMGATLAKQTYGDRLGIAAPQIGINKRVMIVRGNVMFNPEWTPVKAPLESIEEGCYSVPFKAYKVDRAKYGWAKWMNIDGHPMEDRIKGLAAIVFQHEINHLDGICCVDIGQEIKVEDSRTPQNK